MKADVGWGMLAGLFNTGQIALNSPVALAESNTSLSGTDYWFNNVVSGL